jgi:hypothetical protein
LLFPDEFAVFLLVSFRQHLEKSPIRKARIDGNVCDGII